MNSDTADGYTERQRVEKLWHDQKFRQDARVEQRRPNDRAFRKFWEIVGEPRNLMILDFGCGEGFVSVTLAKRGNTLHGFDLSESLIGRARRHAEAANVADRVTFRQMAAENLDYPEDSFDLVIGISILHHTELEVALPRLRRVLKPHGRAVFLEPLNQNLALKLWRSMTPWRRTKTERAFTQSDMATVQRHFSSIRYTYHCLTSMVTAGLLMAAPGSRAVRRLNQSLEQFDDRLLGAFPSLGRFPAITIIEIQK